MIIDFHQHLPNRGDYLEKLIVKMEEVKMEQCVMHSLPVVEGYRGNDGVFMAMEKYPGRIIGSSYVDPREEYAVRTLERDYAKGFRVAKMYPPVGFFPDDPAFNEVFDCINELNMPVMIHSGLTTASFRDPRLGVMSSKYARPINIDGLVRRFRKTKFIIAHMGHPWFLEALSLASLNPNIYIDCSGDAYRGMEICKKSGYAVPYEKFVWGSNCADIEESVNSWTRFFKEVGKEDLLQDFFLNTAHMILGMEE